MSDEQLALLHGDRLDVMWSNFADDSFARIAIELLDALRAERAHVATLTKPQVWRCHECGAEMYDAGGADIANAEIATLTARLARAEAVVEAAREVGAHDALYESIHDDDESSWNRYHGELEARLAAALAEHDGPIGPDMPVPQNSGCDVGTRIRPREAGDGR